MSDFFEKLRQKLAARSVRPLPLPGLSLRESAVLVPLFLRGGRVYVLFTRRPTTLKQHAGQISFPGGARDDVDPTPLHTALRETYEELGIPPERVEVLGMLDEIPTVTQFRIAPFVGVIPPDFPYRPSAQEVAEIIEAPLDELSNPAIHRVEHWTRGEKPHDVYFYDWGRHTIWGATARILKDLFSLLPDCPAQQG